MADITDGYYAVPPDRCAPGYVKPGASVKRLRGGDNGAGELQQEGPDPYSDKDEGAGSGD